MTAQEIVASRAKTVSSNRAYRETEAQKGKREAPAEKKTRPVFVQLIVSAMVFSVIVGVKLTMPDVVEKYRDRVMELMGQEMDVQEVFSTVGQLAGEDTRGTLERAYQSVFGAEPVEEAEDCTTDRTGVVYSLTTTPARVEMLQQVLGFAYVTPVAGELSSAFGFREHPLAGEEKFHYGLDISAEEGSIISAFASGTVTAVGESSELGKYVEVAHSGDYATLYAHCSRINASSGQTVKAGDPIAEVGATGDATGNHLHFELHKGNIYLNPIYYVTLQ